MEVIEAELKFYKSLFKGKTVFCNCDDPYESNFFKYFAMHFAMTLVDAMQISLLYMLYHEYSYDIPMLPIFTLIGVCYEAFVEIKSITEPADIKEKKQQDDFKRLLHQALAEGNLRERVISIIEETTRTRERNGED